MDSMSSSCYAWVIDRDHLEGDPVDPIVGPHNAPASLLEVLAQKGGHAFRMLDDDGEVYYSGRCVWTDASCYSDEEIELAPLHDFGGQNAGCTSIEYRTLIGKAGALEAWGWKRA